MVPAELAMYLPLAAVEGLHGVISIAAGHVVDGLDLLDNVGVVNQGHNRLGVDNRLHSLLVDHRLGGVHQRVAVGGDGQDHLSVGLGLTLGNMDHSSGVGDVLALGGIAEGSDGVVGVGGRLDAVRVGVVAAGVGHGGHGAVGAH